jgi:CRP-like cAMP-binding protein
MHPDLDLVSAFEARLGEHLPGAAELRSRVKRLHFDKGATVFEAGRSCRDVFFVLAGLIKLHYVSAGGDARVRDFVNEGKVFAALESLEDAQAPAWYTATAYEPSTLEVLPYAQIEALARESAPWARCVGLFFLDTALNRGSREHAFLLLPPLERFRVAIQERPWLLERVRQHDMASYIGITPVSLSRLKSRTRSG